MPFTDIKGHPSEADIETLARYGLTRGVEEGRFNPEGSLNRAEFVKFVLTLFCISPTPREQLLEKPFIDTPLEAWFTPWIDKAAQLGIVNGDSVIRPGNAYELGIDPNNLPDQDQGKTTFRPWDSVNRAEFLKIPLQILQFKLTNPNLASETYEDVETRVWYEKYVSFALQEQFFADPRETFFFGTEPAKRADAASLMVVLLQKIHLLEDLAVR